MLPSNNVARNKIRPLPKALNAFWMPSKPFNAGRVELFQYSHWSSQLCTWSDLSFVSVMSVDDWNSGIWQHCSQPEKKNHDYACVGIKLSLSVRVSRWTQEFTCRVQHVMTHFYWLSAMSIKLPRICSLFSLVKISWYSWDSRVHSHSFVWLRVNVHSEACSQAVLQNVMSFFFFGSTTVVCQGLPVPLVGLAFSD